MTPALECPADGRGPKATQKKGQGPEALTFKSDDQKIVLAYRPGKIFTAFMARL
jgi:hypothetical protein